MPDTSQPLLQECTTCGALLDVSDEDPFALMHCPTCGGAMRVRRQFGNFELQEVLGAGGMGAVYRALDSTLNRSVALKLLRKEYSNNPEFIRQFEHEASITAGINHPNVVKVYSTASDHGLFYIAMELVDKGSLDDLMTLQGAVSEAQVLDVGIQIAQGLNAAAKRGLIHRDIKPGNILFSDAHHAKIVDFGLAMPMDKAGEVGGEIWGTPYYVAPEKLETPPREDLRSDIYSLGATLFHAIAGRPPYEAEDASVVALKHLKSQPVSLQAFAPGVSNATAFVINRTLSKEPNERYSSYEELIEHLQYAQRQLAASVGKDRKSSRMVLEDEHSQQMMSWVTVGILSALVLGGLALFAFKDKIFGPSAQERQQQAEASADHAKALLTRFEPSVADARKLLSEGKARQAADLFDKIEAEPDLPQPLHNWVTLQTGLSRYLAGQGVEAKSDFQKLVDRGPYTFDPGEEKLANFFINVGKLAVDPKPQPPSIAREYPKSTFEAIALLVFAAKDWQMGKYEEAGPLFRQFHSATPEAPYTWISEYRGLANHYVELYSQYKEIPDQIKAAHSVSEQKAALPKVKEALSHITRDKKLEASAQAMVDKFEREVTERDQVESKKAADELAADTKALSDAKTKMTSLCGQYRFSEANAAISAAKVTGENAKRDKEVFTKQTAWLMKFKEQLIKDLNQAGYATQLVKRTGIAIPGTVSQASESQVETKTPYGSAPVLWSDLSPDSVFAMARSFMRADAPADRLAEREWNLGVYCLFFSKPREGKALLTAAAQSKPDYQADLALFPETAEAPANTTSSGQ